MLVAAKTSNGKQRNTDNNDTDKFKTLTSHHGCKEMTRTYLKRGVDVPIRADYPVLLA